MNRILLISTGLTLAAATTTLFAADMPDPRAFREQSMQNPNLHRYDGEQFCWHARRAAEDLLRGYEASGDPRWLEEAIVYFDFLVDQLKEDPDGYKGWIGETIWGVTGRADHDQYRADAIVGDAILLQPMVRFAEIVLSDDDLKQQFGEKAQQYVDLATHIGWEKWNHRGTYYRCAAGYGSYKMDDRFIDAESWEWVDRPDRARSDNLNKHSAMGIVILRLYRITGNEEYAERVEEIFSRLKSMFRYFPEDDRVSWNFWMPHGPHDITDNGVASWVAVHPKSAGYQSSEVARMVEVYDSGLVFDRDDIQRLVNTNHWMMPRGDNGEWRSSDGTTNAGQLWSSLARFDDEIRRRHEQSVRRGDGDRNLISRAYFDNVTMKQLGLDRLHVQDESKVRVYDHPPQPGRHLSMTVIIPNRVEIANNDRARFVTQTRSGGELIIELLDTAGEQVLGELHRQGVGGSAQIHLPAWDGTNPANGQQEPGEYVVRWTLGEDVHTQRVWVEQGEQREQPQPAAETETDTSPVLGDLPVRPSAIEPGQALTYDFTADLDSRWHLQGAEINDEHARSGGRSLKLEEGQTATLVFGGDDPLPVRITLWVYDGGAKHADSTINGPSWGVRTADGQFFGIVQFWRRYLDGDGHYAWIHTADNEWFSPKHSNVRRRDGWNEWTFDFTESPSVRRDRDEARLQDRLTPEGAVAIHLRGGSSQAGPLYVDDIRVELPEK